MGVAGRDEERDALRRLYLISGKAYASDSHAGANGGE
jgi:hypothetical protein